MPGAKAAGKEIRVDGHRRAPHLLLERAWGYDYRWLDVSFEVMASDEAALKSYKERVADRRAVARCRGSATRRTSVVNLTTEDKQQTREAPCWSARPTPLVMITYNGGDFESKKAPSTETINKGAIRGGQGGGGRLGGGQG